MTTIDGPSFLWDERPFSTEFDPDTSSRKPAQAGLPAEPGLWVFILGDMTIFGLFFTVFSWEGAQDRDLFATATQSLIQPIGIANTLVLLISSYAVVLALHAHRAAEPDRARRLVVVALACALTFSALKAVEYTAGFNAGHTPGTNIFFTFYYVMTGVHLLHVVVGAVLLGVWRSRITVEQSFAHHRRLAESAAVYWHMVDLLWVLIFTLVYLAGAS